MRYTLEFLFKELVRLDTWNVYVDVALPLYWVGETECVGEKLTTQHSTGDEAGKVVPLFQVRRTCATLLNS